MWILAEAGTSALLFGDRSLLAEAAEAARGGPPLALVTRLRRNGRGWSSTDAWRWMGAEI